MGILDKEKICKDTMSFIYKYTHESALRYPVPEDYVEMAEDMKFSGVSLRIEFPVGEHPQGGKKIVRQIYESGRKAGEDQSGAAGRHKDVPILPIRLYLTYEWAEV